MTSSDVEKDLPSPEKKGESHILEVVGEDGPWQRRVFLVMLFCAIPSATHNLSMAFLAPNLDHWCARPTGSNLSLEQWQQVALPPGGGQCSRYLHYNLSLDAGQSSNETVQDKELTPCYLWEYDESFYTSTVTSQWDLVCDREWLVSLSKSIFMAGFLLSVFLFGHLADRLGRRPVMSWCAVIAVCSAVVCAFSTSFAMFAAARFCVALGISGVSTTGFVLMMEVVGPDLRSIYGVAIQFGWCLGFVCLPAIAWLLRDWFWIQLALTAPCLLLLFIWWAVPESPRWLLSQGRTDEAYEVLRKAVKKNNKSEAILDAAFKNYSSKQEENASERPKGTVLDLLRTPGLWQKTLNLYFVWFVNAFVYYGLSYNTNELAGDPFVNFAVSGAIEFPAYVISILVIHSLGRRKPLAGAMFVGGLACLLQPPLPSEPWWLTVSVSMVGKFCITCSFAVAFVYTAEIFPTVVRNVGLGTASLCARFGSIIAPFVRELGQATHPSLPLLVFGVLSVLAGVAVLLLPETHRRDVPDTLKEAAERGRHRKPKTTPTSKPCQNGHAVDSGPDEDPPEEQPPPPSPKPIATLPRENGKKLADVPEEDPELGQEMTVLPPEDEETAEEPETVEEKEEETERPTDVENISLVVEEEQVTQQSDIAEDSAQERKTAL